MMAARNQLTDDQWNCIREVFPPPAPTGRPRVDRRKVLNGIFWILRTGAPWRDMPEEFGKWGTVYDLFTTWNSDGTLREILRKLQSAFVEIEAIDDELWCIDGTVVRAARCAAGAKKGGPKVS